MHSEVPVKDEVPLPHTWRKIEVGLWSDQDHWCRVPAAHSNYSPKVVFVILRVFRHFDRGIVTIVPFKMHQPIFDPGFRH